MKKILLSLSFFLVLTISLRAQDEAIYSQYLFHPILVNPAYSGFKDNHELLINYKNAYASFPGSPKSYTLSFNGPVAPKLGFGATVFNDIAGDLSKFKGQASVAYKFELGSVKLNAGIGAQVHKFQLANGAILDSGIDPDDPYLRAAANGSTFFSSSLGLYGEQNGKLKFGIAVVDLVRTRIDQIQSTTVNSDPLFNFFNAWVGYMYDVANYNFTVEPSIMIKRLRDVPFQADFNVKMGFLEDQFFGGLTYSLGGYSKTSFLLGTRINKFRLFYSYDIALEEIQKYNNGGHELSLSFEINANFKKITK